MIEDIYRVNRPSMGPLEPLYYLLSEWVKRRDIKGGFLGRGLTRNLFGAGLIRHFSQKGLRPKNFLAGLGFLRFPRSWPIWRRCPIMCRVL